MNNIKLSTFIISILIIIMLTICLTGFIFKKEPVRPVKLIVLDSLNNEPLGNAVIYYCIQTVRQKTFLGIPIIDPLEYPKVVMERYFTDMSGSILIPEHRLKLKRYEEVISEYIYVNLDLINKTQKIDDFFEARSNEKYNPISYLKGAIIEGSKRELDPKDYNLDSSKNKFIYILNGKSLIKDYEEIIVKLERW